MPIRRTRPCPFSIQVVPQVIEQEEFDISAPPPQTLNIQAIVNDAIDYAVKEATTRYPASKVKGRLYDRIKLYAADSANTAANRAIEESLTEGPATILIRQEALSGAILAAQQVLEELSRARIQNSVTDAVNNAVINSLKTYPTEREFIDEIRAGSFTAASEVAQSLLESNTQEDIAIARIEYVASITATSIAQSKFELRQEAEQRRINEEERIRAINNSIELVVTLTVSLVLGSYPQVQPFAEELRTIINTATLSEAQLSISSGTPADVAIQNIRVKANNSGTSYAQNKIAELQRNEQERRDLEILRRRQINEWFQASIERILNEVLTRYTDSRLEEYRAEIKSYMTEEGLKQKQISLDSGEPYEVAISNITSRANVAAVNKIDVILLGLNTKTVIITTEGQQTLSDTGVGAARLDAVALEGASQLPPPPSPPDYPAPSYKPTEEQEALSDVGVGGTGLDAPALDSFVDRNGLGLNPSPSPPPEIAFVGLIPLNNSPTYQKNKSLSIINFPPDAGCVIYEIIDQRTKKLISTGFSLINTTNFKTSLNFDNSNVGKTVSLKATIFKSASERSSGKPPITTKTANGIKLRK